MIKKWIFFAKTLPKTKTGILAKYTTNCFSILISNKSIIRIPIIATIKLPISVIFEFFTKKLYIKG